MADSEFKLPASSYEEVSKIIQAYAQINKPASLGDVSRRAGINPTTVSGNNGFLMSVGLVEGGKSKTATPIGKQIGDAMGHGLDEEIGRLLRDVVGASEFLKSILGAVRIRKGMEESALKAHIAYSAGLSKTPSVMTGTGAVVELLRRSGSIVETDGKLVTSPLSVDPVVPAESPSKRPDASGSGATVVRYNAPLAAPGISLSIEVQIVVGAGDLDGLGDKLRQVVDQFHGLKEGE